MEKPGLIHETPLSEIEQEIILLVEDDEILRHVIQDVLSDRYVIDCAVCAAEAKMLLQDNAYDLILSDVVLGDDSGLNLLQWARIQVEDIPPIILMTAYPSMDMAIKAIDLGVTAFLQKPFHITAIESAVEKAIAERRIHRCRTVFQQYLERSNGIYRQAIADAVVEQRALFMSTLDTLAQTIDARDHYTGRHSISVSQLSRRLAQAMGLDAATIHDTETAGLLHDIGKIAIPEAVLCKPTALTDEEFTLMRSHPTRAIEILQALPDMSNIINAIHSHHEHYNGQGYPNRLAGKDIPTMGRILAICDAWDAMTTDRPYRKALSPTKAQQIMQDCRHTQFDPELVDIFLNEMRPTA